jgi:transcriptional regulator with XRE-family HTH domain
MPNRQSIGREAGRFSTWLLRDLGRELRVARLIAGMTQVEVAARLGTSAAHVSRVEHGLLTTFNVVELTRHAAVVGLKPWVRLYPVIARPLDSGQLALLSRFRVRISDAWSVTLEAPMPIPGDLRAADALMAINGCTCVVEVITRLADFQAQLRAALIKKRDLHATRLILVVAANATNRRALLQAGAAVDDAFPLGTKATLRALAAGMDPGADGLVLL